MAGDLALRIPVTEVRGCDRACRVVDEELREWRRRWRDRHAEVVDPRRRLAVIDPLLVGRGTTQLTEDLSRVEEPRRRAAAGGRAVARPRPIGRVATQGGAHGVERDIPGKFEEVVVVLDEARSEAALEE